MAIKQEDLKKNGLADKITQSMIALRFDNDDEMLKEIKLLADVHGLSVPMTVKMLLGYAFNQINETGKEFKPVVVFESK